MLAQSHWTFGALTLRRIVEELFSDCTHEQLDENRSWLLPRFQDASSGNLIISIQSFVIRQDGSTILVDSCGGNDKDRKRPRRNWPWLETLAAAGVTPQDINVVLCTHLHVDHVGWNTRLENGRWVPMFPNARYLIAQREWDYWRGAGPAAFAFTGDYITDSVLPIFKTGQADLIGDQHMLASNITLEAAPGHTPGLTMVRLTGGRQEAIL
jgi:glyoxylase-like metal-dependent hydrolase (beta-lactamase superfamily II)